MASLIRPKNMAELKKALECQPLLLAGGTDWIIRHRGSLGAGSVVVDLSCVTEMKDIKETKEGLFVGALSTMSLLATDSAVRRSASALSDAASSVGSVQIRNMATLGGNAANASPAADTPCALAALGASAWIVSAHGERTAPVEEIAAGPNENTLARDEAIGGFILPRGMRISAFLKVGSRSQVTIARLNMAASCVVRGGMFCDVRMYIGTLGHPAIRCTECEQALALPPGERAQAAMECGTEFVARMIPGRSTLSYKQSALAALCCDMEAMLSRKEAA